jgi:tripartite ATP-independent transporter DctM subunit
MLLVSLIAIMIVFFGIGMPVAFAMGLTALTFLIMNGVPLGLIPNRMLAGVDSFVLMGVPFFLLAGSLMNTGGITKRLVDFATALVGHLRGGLSHVTVVANMIMAGMSGSATADAAGTGAFLIPAMEKGGYPKAYAAAVVAAASTIGPIIPPSVPFVIFGALAGVSVGRLFLGGAIPGVIMGIFLMAACYWVAVRRNYPKGKRATLLQLAAKFWDAILALMTPVIILGGILSGVFTPTEAAVIAVVYSLVLGLFVYRELKFSDLPKIFLEVGINTAVVMFIVACSTAMTWILAREQAGQELTKFMLGISASPWVLLILINVLVLALGCVLEVFVIMVILVPILMPLIKTIGVDPVHFGVFFTLNLMIGLLTPPVGMVMYVVCAIARISIAEFTREAWPFLIALLFALFTVTFIPGLVLWLPNYVMGPGR